MYVAESKQARKPRAKSKRPEWFVYMLVLLSGPHMGKLYVGKTYDPEMRLRQHNSPKSKTKRTSRWTEGHKHQWALVWVVSGFRQEDHALKFEWRCQKLKMGDFKGEPMTTCAYKYLTLPPTRRYQRHIKYMTRNMLITCCLPRWSTTTGLAKNLTDGLVITWYKHEFAPKNSCGDFTNFALESCEYLPPGNFVTQKFITAEEILDRNQLSLPKRRRKIETENVKTNFKVDDHKDGKTVDQIKKLIEFKMRKITELDDIIDLT